MKPLIVLILALLGLNLPAIAQDDDMFNYKIIKNNGDTIYTIDTWYRYYQGFNGFYMKSIYVKVDGEDMEFTVDDTKRIEMQDVKDETNKMVLITTRVRAMFTNTMAFLPIQFEGRRFKLGVIHWTQRGNGSGINYYLYDPEREGGEAHIYLNTPGKGLKKANLGMGSAIKTFLRNYPTVKKMIDEKVFHKDTIARHPELVVQYLDEHFTEEDGK